MPTRFGRQNEAILDGENGNAVAEPFEDGLFNGRRNHIDPDANLHRIGKEEVRKAAQILKDYKAGKANLEARIVEDELWYELRHWEVLRRSGKNKNVVAPEPTSAWLFNAILNKHADAMDNYPEPVVKPRERSDEGSAKILSSILPVVLEHNKFEDTYDDNWWEKLKHGTAAYGIFWNNSKENGLGDVDIRPVDLLKLFWEPGITDLQESRNLFIVDMIDKDILNEEYPEFEGKLNGNSFDVTQYLYDENINTDDKVIVVDWYYKITEGGRTLLHYAKFCGDELLYASENDPECAGRGYYDHGMYPVVLDTMFPEKGTPAGFGYVAICKDPELYIDKLSANIMESSVMGTKKRFFVSSSTNVNPEDFADWSQPIVRVEGEISDTRIREIEVTPPSPIYQNVLQQKIEEMKDTAANRDVNSGGTASGVSAASAIAALQEAGNKVSRDMISASYRAYTRIIELVIEMIRQFYSISRSFRITGETGYEYVDFNNLAIRPQQTGFDSMGNPLVREPVFDIAIKAQKKNPFSKMEENERAKELYAMGFFDPNRAQESMGALEMMDFEGIEKVRDYVRQGQTLLNVVQQLQMQLMDAQNYIAFLTGRMPMNPQGQPVQQTGNPAQAPGGRTKDVDAGSGNSFASGVMQAHTPMTSYGNRLAKRSAPDMNAGTANPMQ